MMLNKTAVDSIAIWIPTLGSFTAKFVKPVLLSTGVGIENFINIDSAPINVSQRVCLNNTIFRQVRKVMISGSYTFNPSSTALSALREITEYQSESKISVPGVGFIINPSALIVDTFSDMVWSNPYSGANRNKVMSDISMTFSSSPPTAISLGGLLAIPNIANVFNGFGIF